MDTMPQGVLQADGNYDPMKYVREPNEYEFPSSSWEESAVRQATLSITMPRAEIRKLVKPPPRVMPTPTPASVHHSPAITVEEVIQDSARLYPDAQSSFSGGPAGYSGSLRNGWSSN